MPRPRFDAALLILAVGFGFSLAANMLWTWPGGVVRILGGALASLALPGAIHLWDRIPLPPPIGFRVWRWTLQVPVMRVLRAVTMAGIAAMAAFTTFSHASQLLVAHGEDPLLAQLYPVMTELLVVMGVLARKVPPAEVTKAVRKPAPVKPQPARQEPVRVEAAPPVEQGVGTSTPRSWTVANWPVTAREIQIATGVTKGYAHKLRERVKAEVVAS